MNYQNITKNILNMNKIITILFLIFLIGCSNKTVDKKEIINIFNEVNTANIELNGEKIYQLTDNESHEYYTDLLKKIKNLDSIEINKLNLTDKINLLSVRAVLSDNDIKKISGKELMIAMYTKINTMDTAKINNIKKMELMNIRINNNVALANLAINKNIIQPKFNLKFLKENGKWKYNFISMSNLVNDQLKMMCKKNGMSEMDFIKLVFSNPNVQSKKLKKLNEIWNPIE